MGITIVKGEQWATMVDVISYHHHPLTIVFPNGTPGTGDAAAQVGGRRIDEEGKPRHPAAPTPSRVGHV
jgi:hypothetical protein